MISRLPDPPTVPPKRDHARSTTFAYATPFPPQPPLVPHSPHHHITGNSVEPLGSRKESKKKFNHFYSPFQSSFSSLPLHLHFLSDRLLTFFPSSSPGFILPPHVSICQYHISDITAVFFYPSLISLPDPTDIVHATHPP